MKQSKPLNPWKFYFLCGTPFWVLLAPKLTGLVAWSWWWITLPVWLPVMVAGVSIDFSKKFKAAFGQNATFKRVNTGTDELSTDAGDNKPSSGGTTSGSGSTNPGIDG